MAKKVTDTNPHLKNKEDRVERVARSQSASHNIEGIEISTTRIKQMLTRKSAPRLSRRK